MLGAFVGGAPMGWTAVAAAAAMLVADMREPAWIFTGGSVDLQLLVFFTALFVVMAGFANTQLPARAWQHAATAVSMSSGAGVAWFAILVVAGSNTVSNVPLVLLLAPAIGAMPSALDVRTAWLLLSFVATVAGNLTLIGSVANLIVAERAKPHYELGFGEYARFGVPSTAVVVLLGTAVTFGMLR